MTFRVLPGRALLAVLLLGLMAPACSRRPETSRREARPAPELGTPAAAAPTHAARVKPARPLAVPTEANLPIRVTAILNTTTRSLVGLVDAQGTRQALAATGDVFAGYTVLRIDTEHDTVDLAKDGQTFRVGLSQVTTPAPQAPAMAAPAVPPEATSDLNLMAMLARYPEVRAKLAKAEDGIETVLRQHPELRARLTNAEQSIDSMLRQHPELQALGANAPNSIEAVLQRDPALAAKLTNQVVNAGGMRPTEGEQLPRLECLTGSNGLENAASKQPADSPPAEAP